LGRDDVRRNRRGAGHSREHGGVALSLRSVRIAQADQTCVDMNERENELFEAELRRLNPARMPAEFESRLNASRPRPSREFETRQSSQVWRLEWSLWRGWLAPVNAVAVARLVVVSQLERGTHYAPP